MEKKFPPTLDIGSHSNAAPQPLPEAEAAQERTLEAVGCRRLFGAGGVREVRSVLIVPSHRRPPPATG